MKTIRLFDHPLSARAPQVFSAPSIGEWLLGHYGKAPTVTVQVFRGAPSAATEISRDLKALLANDADVYTVLQTPADGLAIAEAVIWIWENITYIAAAYSIGSALLATNPSMPANVNRTSASPNNGLGPRENQVRLRQRFEDIFGTVRAIPSLLMPTYNKYINHKRVEYGYYCVSRGHLAIADVRDADTLIADIPNASAAFYAPFTSPNSGDAPQLLIGDPIIDRVLTVRRSTEVDGFALKALNQVQLAATNDYTFTADPGGDILQQSTTNPNFSAVAEPGDLVTVTLGTVTISRGAGNGTLTIDGGANTVAIDVIDGWTNGGLQIGDTVTLANWSEAGNNGAATVLSFPDAYKVELSGSGRTTETYPAASVSWQRDFSGTREIFSVGDGQVVLVNDSNAWLSGSDGAVAAAVQLAGKSHISPWITLTAADRTEVWVNLAALQGMFRDKGGKSETTVDYEIQIEQLDPDDLTPTGTVETVTGSISGKVSDERAQTVEHVTGWTGPCRVRMARTSLYEYAFEGTIVDEVKWIDLYAVSPVDKDDFGALTTVHTVTMATPRATSARTRQLNCLATRKLPIWSGSAFSGAFDATGALASGSIDATTRIVDILPAVTVDPLIGNRDISEIDMAQVWAVQQQLDELHEDAGQFSYTFDADSFSFEDTLAAIANAVFCVAYRQAGKIRLALDRPQTSSSRLFTHRNKEPGAETLNRTFANDGDFDGVEFVYVDPDTEQSETIRLPLDGSAVKPKRYEIPGIRSFAQAWLRAWREYLKIKGQRLAIETSCTTDARVLLPNVRVDIVDNTRFKAYDGEVVGQDGLTLRLSKRVAFEAGQDHSIVLMRRDGTLQAIPCAEGAAAFEVVLQSLPSQAVVTEHGAEGVRTIYSFAADSARGAMAYLVQEIDPPSKGYVTVRAVNYSDEYYAMDLEPIPDSASVIN